MATLDITFVFDVSKKTQFCLLNPIKESVISGSTKRFSLSISTTSALGNLLISFDFELIFSESEIIIAH